MTELWRKGKYTNPDCLIIIESQEVRDETEPLPSQLTAPETRYWQLHYLFIYYVH